MMEILSCTDRGMSKESGGRIISLGNQADMIVPGAHQPKWEVDFYPIANHKATHCLPNKAISCRIKKRPSLSESELGGYTNCIKGMREGGRPRAYASKLIKVETNINHMISSDN